MINPMHQIKTGAVILLIVSLPDEPKEVMFSIQQDRNILHTWIESMEEMELTIEHDLPEGQWEILARLNDLTDDHWMFICKSGRHDNMFVDFTEDSTRYAHLLKSIEASISSFRQLINPETNPLILKSVAGSH